MLRQTVLVWDDSATEVSPDFCVALLPVSCCARGCDALCRVDWIDADRLVDGCHHFKRFDEIASGSSSFQNSLNCRSFSSYRASSGVLVRFGSSPFNSLETLDILHQI